MAGKETSSIVRRYFEAGGADDLAAWDGICDADMVLYPGFAEPIIGLERVKRFTADFHTAMSPYSLTVDDFIVENERAAVRWTASGTHSAPMSTPGGMVPATGKRVSMTGTSFLRVADGRIVEERVQADVLSMMQQLGIIPSPHTPS